MTPPGNNKRQTGRRGFTLAEALVASAISVMVLAVVIGNFAYIRRTQFVQQQVGAMNQNLRMALGAMARDLRMAGYGLPIDAAEIPTWVDWTTNAQGPVTIRAGASVADPDSFTVVGAFEAPVARLQATSVVDAAVIQVTDASNALFNTTDRKLIFIGKQELARITAISGNALTISTHPTANEGLVYQYGVATPIELIEAVTYSCNLTPTGYPHRPYLLRDTHSSAVSNDLRKLLAVDIENLQVNASTNDGGVTVALAGRTADPIIGYSHPDTGDSYRRGTVRIKIQPRNLR